MWNIVWRFHRAWDIVFLLLIFFFLIQISIHFSQVFKAYTAVIMFEKNEVNFLRTLDLKIKSSSIPSSSVFKGKSAAYTENLVFSEELLK